MIDAEDDMSLSAAHESKRVIRIDRFRAEREQYREPRLTEPRSVVLRSPFASVLTERQISHRRRMLEFARTQRSDAAP
jgi:hypothetical protein